MKKMICSANSDSYSIAIRLRSLGWLYLFFVYFHEKLPQIILNWVSHKHFFSKYTNLPLLWLVIFKVYTSEQVVLTWRSIRKTGWGICLLWKCAAFENFFDTKKWQIFSYKPYVLAFLISGMSSLPETFSLKSQTNPWRCPKKSVLITEDVELVLTSNSRYFHTLVVYDSSIHSTMSNSLVLAIGYLCISG